MITFYSQLTNYQNDLISKSGAIHFRFQIPISVTVQFTECQKE